MILSLCVKTPKIGITENFKLNIYSGEVTKIVSIEEKLVNCKKKFSEDVHEKKTSTSLRYVCVLGVGRSLSLVESMYHDIHKAIG